MFNNRSLLVEFIVKVFVAFLSNAIARVHRDVGFDTEPCQDRPNNGSIKSGISIEENALNINGKASKVQMLSYLRQLCFCQTIISGSFSVICLVIDVMLSYFLLYLQILQQSLIRYLSLDIKCVRRFLLQVLTYYQCSMS